MNFPRITTINRIIYPPFKHPPHHSIKWQRISNGRKNLWTSTNSFNISCLDGLPHQIPHYYVILLRICCGLTLLNPCLAVVGTLWATSRSEQGYKSPLVCILILFHCYCATTPQSTSLSLSSSAHELGWLLFYYLNRESSDIVVRTWP